MIPSAAGGFTQAELDDASLSAQSDVLAELAEVGFDISSWKTTATTPPSVVEIIKQLASARVWGRAYHLSGASQDDPNQSFGQHLLQTANNALESILRRRTLLAAKDGAIIRASSAAVGKGIPKIIKPANPQAVTDDDISRHIRTYGPYDAKYQ